MPIYSLDDTIAAISTPLGAAGLGIVRLSGKESIAIAESIFKPASKKQLAEAHSHTLHHGWIQDSGRIIDEVMLGVMKNPHSYTGEDIIEISAHGGPVVLRQILQLCAQKGARLAGPGEFTFRAFINKKMDLARAEAVAELISSKTELSAQAALNQLQGNLSEKTQSWRKQIVDLLSRIEAALDYAQEDIKFIQSNELSHSLSLLYRDIIKLQSTADKGKLLRDGARISIIGRPNVGKSLLFNNLLERERAIVTEIPGTTRDIIEETLDIKGFPFVITDGAGLRRYPKDPVEKIGQERAVDSLNRADLVLFLLDASKTLTRADFHIAELLKSKFKGKKIIVVLNKIDKPVKLTENNARKLMPGASVYVRISALTNAGIPELERAVLSCIETSKISLDEPLITNTRHRDILGRAAHEIKNAINLHKKNASEEVIAFHLREALNAIGEITGETATEKILENIFSNFCVGK